MNGMISVVTSRSFGCSTVRAAMIPVTLQPKPIISGIKDLPFSPIICIKRSVTKAARAM